MRSPARILIVTLAAVSIWAIWANTPWKRPGPRLENAPPVAPLETSPVGAEPALVIHNARPRPAECNPPESMQLTVEPRKQETVGWCWAASGQMILASLQPPKTVEQCDEANKWSTLNTCCSGPERPPACVDPGGWPPFGAYNYSAARTDNAPLTWEDVKTQIGCLRQPFAFSWHWDGGGGHMMVAIGYQTQPSLQLIVKDPGGIAGNSLDDIKLEYARYKESPPEETTGEGLRYTHWDDFYDFESIKATEDE